MNVIPLGSDSSDAYERFLAGHPGRMLYYTLAYRELIRCHLGCRAEYFAVVDEDGELHGILPTMTKAGRYGPVLNSLPFFGSHGGVLGNSPHAEALLWEFWNKLAGEVAAATVILNPFCDERPPVTWTHQDSRIGSMTTLPDDPSAENILSGIESSARRNYQKAIRLGIDVVEDNDQVQILHDIHVENMKAINGRAKEIAFFQELSRYFVPGRDYKIYTARKDGEIIAALLVFLSGRSVEYYTPATRLIYRDLQASSLLLVRAMQDAVRAGYRLWNWGGTWVGQESLARFKGKWGGKSRSYPYFTRVNAPDILRADPAELVREYPYFYVYPFAALNEAQESPS